MEETYQELLNYTLTHPGQNFIHQHVVDAFAAQTAGPKTKPVTVFFALAGLYLAIEKGFTGKEVQNAHVRMSEGSKAWPEFQLPEFRGSLTYREVMQHGPGEARDMAIFQWCKSVWKSFASQHQLVKQATEEWLYR